MRRALAIAGAVSALLIATLLLSRSRSTETAGSIDGEASPAQKEVQDSTSVRAGVVIDRRRIAGRTIDAHGSAVAGALVCATHTEVGRATCLESDQAGTFAIEPLLGARYGISASAPGRVLEIDLKEQVIDVRAASREDLRLSLIESEHIVRGTIRDHGGGPIAGARVHDWNASTYSDADGAYALTVRSSNAYLFVEADGYARVQQWSYAPARGIDFELVPAASLRGVVVDKGSSLPVAGAIIEASKLEGFATRRAISDRDGRFVIDTLDQGRHRLSARAEHAYGQAGESVFVDPAGTPKEVRIEVRQAFRVSGRALYEGTDEPCPNGMVWADGRNQTSVESAIRNGDVELGPLPPDIYDLRIYCGNGPGTEPTTELRVDHDLKDVVWHVPGRFTIRGVVVDDDDHPVPSSSLRLEGPGVARDSTRADSEGRFAFHVLEAGTYSVRAKASFGELGSSTCTVSGEETFVRIRAKKSGTIEGRVIDESDRPLPIIAINLVREGATWTDAYSVTDADGHFANEGLAPGDYRIDLACDCEREDAGALFHVDEGQRTIVTLHTKYSSATIRGRVIDASGEPIANAHVGVAAEPIELEILRRKKRDFRQLSDGDGTFVFRNLSRGKHTVLAWRDSGPDVFANGVEDGATIELRLPSGGAFGGTVSLRSGGSPTSFSVSAKASDGWERRESFVRTEGRWMLEDLPRGDYRLTFDAAEGFATKDLSLDEGEAKSDVRIELEGLLTIRGRVLDSERGTPLAYVPIALEVRNGARLTTWPEAQTDADGAFHFDGVPPAKAKLTIARAWWSAHDCPGSNTTWITVPATPDQELAPVRIRCGGELREGSR